MRTILVLAGGIANQEEAQKAAQDADFVIAADGGFTVARAAGIHVDLLLGDLDSLSAVPEAVPILRVPQEKDVTDLELALDHAVTLNPERIVVVGAFGGRLDHTLANANLLEKYDLPIILFHEGFRVYLVAEKVEIPGSCGDLVSLIPLTNEARGIFTQGLRYPLCDGVLFRASTRGVSNEVVSLPCVVEVRAGKLLLIHKPKDVQTRSIRIGSKVRLNGLNTSPKISKVTIPNSASSSASPRITGVWPSPWGRIM